MDLQKNVIDKEILDAILLLAQTEGIFTEPAGGVSISILQKMVEQGKIDTNDKVVCYVTGNGLKATESIMEVLQKPTVMNADVGRNIGGSKLMANIIFTIPSVLNQSGGEKKIEISADSLIDCVFKNI